MELNVFLMPAGNKQALKHMEATLLNPVQLNSLSKFLSNKDIENLSKIFPDGAATLWGISPGTRNDSKWNILKNNDIVIFLPSRGNTLLTYVAYKLNAKNKELAEHLWGSDKIDPKKTWEYFFFVKIEKSLEIDKRTFLTDLLGYSKKDNLQEFRNVSKRIKSEFKSLQKFLAILKNYEMPLNQFKSEVEEELNKEFISKKLHILKEKLKNSPPTTKFVECKGRKISRSTTVKLIVKEEANYQCEACAFTFKKRNGENYVECAHIKPLAESFYDSPDNVAALCPNCHARLDKGDLLEKLKILEKLKSNKRLRKTVEEEIEKIKERIT